MWLCDAVHLAGRDWGCGVERLCRHVTRGRGVEIMWLAQFLT